MLHPDFPVSEGCYQLTKEWSVTLPAPFNRRLEEDDMVFWRPGLTLWTAIWNNNKQQSQEERLRVLRGDVSESAFDIEEAQKHGQTFLSYRLAEPENDTPVPALYCFAIGEGGHVQMALYFDDEAELATARDIAFSFSEDAAGAGA